MCFSLAFRQTFYSSWKRLFSFGSSGSLHPGVFLAIIVSLLSFYFHLVVKGPLASLKISHFDFENSEESDSYVIKTSFSGLERVPLWVARELGQCPYPMV